MVLSIPMPSLALLVKEKVVKVRRTRVKETKAKGSVNLLAMLLRLRKLKVAATCMRGMDMFQ